LGSVTIIAAILGTTAKEEQPVDYEAVRAGLEQAIPYNQFIGLEVLEVGEGVGVVRLPEADNLKNHVGSQHAGALFSAGEAASGGAFVGAFAERMGEITPLARNAEIDYLKLAKGPITATARLAEEKTALLERLEADGKVEFPVSVELVDEQGNTVAAMTVRWHIRKLA
jgi:acyl-coenzyme A thioesterase PaaI-like protein